MPINYEAAKTLIKGLVQKMKTFRGNWNQNDPTADDYIKNRPFYTGDPVETVLVEDSTVSFSELGGGIYKGEFSSRFFPTIGETYKVSWDGTVYECVCVSIQGAHVIGNASLSGAGSDSGEPFLMVAFDTGEIIIGSTETSDSHTFSISGIVQEVVKLDKKYLPDLDLAPVAKSGDYYDLNNRPTVYNDVVRYSVSQGLTSAQQNIARQNIDAASTSAVAGVVKYTASQDLSVTQKQQARTNIGAGTSSFSGSYNDLTDKPDVIQSDWDISDTNNPAYIKNRTHYVESDIDIIVEKKNLGMSASVSGSVSGQNLYYRSTSFSSLNISDAPNIKEGYTCKIDFYGNSPTYTYSDTISGKLSKFTGTKGYKYEIYAFGNIYYFNGVTIPPIPIDISSDSDNGIPYAGFIQLAYYNGQLRTDHSGICIVFLDSQTGIGRGLYVDISIIFPTAVHQLDEKYIPSTIQRVGDDLIIPSSTSDSDKKFKITVDDSGKPTFTNSSDSADSYTPTDLPSVTTSDSGKFLRVSSTGEWVAETIPNASGVSF